MCFMVGIMSSFIETKPWRTLRSVISKMRCSARSRITAVSSLPAKHSCWISPVALMSERSTDLLWTMRMCCSRLAEVAA